MSSGKGLLGGIDAGGTTFKLGVANADGTLLGKARIPTTTPQETLDKCKVAFRALAQDVGKDISSIGVASFGPVDVDPQSRGYGQILETPKLGWSGANIRERLQTELGLLVLLDTDVNAALLAECARGAARGVNRAAYVTIGTGVGVGVTVDGAFAGRPFHPELGHIRVERHERDRAFPGVCNIHGACLEGLLSAPALIARFGALERRGQGDPCWDIAGWYLAQLCLTLMLSFRLERIVLGGGVMNAPSLLANTREHYASLLGRYLTHEERVAEQLIVSAALGDDAGLHGAIELARSSARRGEK